MDRCKNKKGFSLAEMLMVVAIIVILFALAVPAIFSIQKNIRQEEMDSKAEIIYTAVSNKLSSLYASGKGYTYDLESLEIDGKTYHITEVPSDAPSEDTEKGGRLYTPYGNYLYFFTSEDDVSNDLCGDDVIDGNITGHFVVEIMPYGAKTSLGEKNQITAGSVYGVYYSENLEEFDVASQYRNSSYSSDYVTTYRSKNKRLSNTNGYVGYYGGSLLGGSSSGGSLSITSVQITSNEVVNKAIVKAKKPVGDDAYNTFTFTISDSYGNERVITYNEQYKNFSYIGADGATYSINNGSISVTNLGVNYTFTFILDDLSKSSTRFDSLYGSNSGSSYSDKQKLVSGSNIKFTAYVESDDKSIQPSNTVSEKGNSIFAYDSNSDKNTALISNPRHLQNLDSSSNVSKDITSAKLLNDISLSDTSDFATAYSSYFNNYLNIEKISSSGVISSSNVINFKGITNSNLNSFDGNGYSISNLSTSSGGLFDSVSNTLSISNVNLIGERVINSNKSVGGLIGTNNGNVSIDSVGLYLTTSDIPSSITSDMGLESVRWIKGSVSGGLVGSNTGTLNITNSFASTVIGQTGSTTGGLIGSNTGSATIYKSYADSYLFGTSVGGLVGFTLDNYNVNISSSYVAGYVGLDSNSNAISAGLVNGNAKIKNSYTILSSYLTKTSRISGVNRTVIDRTKPGNFVSSALNVSDSSGLYYKIKSTNNNDYGTQITTVNDMNMGSDFTTDSSLSSNPYRLLGQSLNNYSYKKIVGLNHYGDWDASFSSGSLVYFEKYSDGSYGFDGASVDISLNNEKTLVGDGYGVVYRKDDSIPESFTVSTSYASQTISKSDSHYEVTVNNVTYWIYPLNNSLNNPSSVSSDYYYSLSITSQGETKYFNFNPHFARSVNEIDGKDDKTSKPSEVSIRSARQLYNLSKYYDSSYKNVLGNVTYNQERNIDYKEYDWNFTNFGTISSQSPIGEDENSSFSATYNGGTYEINNISFITQSGFYTGLFGYNSGTIKNVVLAVDYDSNNPYYSKRSTSISANQYVYIGVLAGYNKGTIDNSAVANYSFSGNGKIYGYQNSFVYIGGFAGYNEGTITSSSADLPKISVSMFRATCYTGSFVGYNTGTINDSYGISHIDSEVRSGTTIIAGFVGYNNGSINNTYCATALTSSGDGSYSYPYAPREGSGTVRNSYYLYQGSYQYVDGLYSYAGDNLDTSGTYKTYDQLKNLSSGYTAKSSKHFDVTHSLSEDETNYPYKAVVKDSNGNLIHYGEWQVAPSLGTFGMFYWEHETSGQNNGYNITYLGSENGVVQYASTLCTAHDDGGVISEYGYGYYVLGDGDVRLDTASITTSGDTINTAAKAALEAQIPGLTFYPYTTTTDTSNDYIYLSGSSTNGTFKVTYNGEKSTEYLTYSVSPFFGNAFSLNTGESSDVDTSGSSYKMYIDTTVGYSENPYEVRSADQLQYINWNSSSKSTSELVTASNYSTYNYLMNCNGHASSSNIVTKDNAGNKENYNLVFNQSHDLNAENIENFTPIAGAGTSADWSYTSNLYAWFGSEFNGQSYKIQELNISSKAFSVGLFGTTTGATLKNIILYSTKGATIQRNTENTDSRGAYSLGGLVGVAYDYKSALGRTIENCAIAGYKIVDNSKNPQGLGEANVGGLTGVSSVNINKCSSVVDIEINCTHKDQWGNFTMATWGNYVRVGGITGSIQNEVSNSYSGGSITVGEATLDETYNSSSSYVDQGSSSTASKNNSTNVYLSGIAGGAFTMNYQNITGQTSSYDGSPKVTNCYTYITFPTMEGTIRNITMFACVADRFEYASTTVKNCYYLESSANFEMNLPSYYFSGSSVRDCMSADLKNKMLMGSAKWMYKMYNGNDSGNDQGTFTNVSSKTYEEMESSDMSALLGNAFDKVTTTYQGETVDGKYSFPAGNTSLDGKNYPFPTVIRENSINVHYGTWPTKTAYFENGIDTLDIFDSISDDNYAYKEFKLINKYSDINADTLTFETDDEGKMYVDVQKNYESTDDGNSYYTVKVKALKTGSATITAKWTNIDGEDCSASFIVTVSANLKVTASPNDITQANGEATSYSIKKKDSSNNYVEATNSTGSIDYSDNKHTSWNFTSTKIGEDEAVTISSDKNKLNIKNIGYNATVTATATYEYGTGDKYTASAIINVKTDGTVGISDNTTYNEYSIKSSDTGTQENYSTVTYSKDLAPTSSNTYFLYEHNLDILKSLSKDKITLTDSDGKAITIGDNEKLELTVADKIESNSINIDNSFNSLGIEILYRSSDLAKTISGYLNADVAYGNATYKLKLPVTIKVTPYVLTLNTNGGSLNDKEVYSLDITSDVDLSTDSYIPTKEGYNFVGWYFDKELTHEIISITMDSVYSDTTLYAKWDAKKGSIEFNYNDEKTPSETLKVTYGSSSVSGIKAGDKEGYSIEGWYGTDNNKILDSEGKVVNQNLFNQYVLDSLDEPSSIQTLTAKWEQKVTLTLKLGDSTFLTKTYGKDTKLSGKYDEFVPTVETGKVFKGWYNGDTQIIDENGNVNGTFTLDKDYELTGKLVNKHNIYLQTSDGSITFNSDSPITFEEGASLDNISFVPALKDGYTLEGWYLNDVKVINADGTVVDSSIFSSTSDVTLYAKFKVTAYVEASSLEDNKEYVIVSGTYAMGNSTTFSYYLNGSNITINTLEGKNYISSNSVSNANVWTYSNSKLKNKENSKYLYSYVQDYWFWTNYYLSTDLSESSDIVFNNGTLKVGNYYLYIDVSKFGIKNNSSSSSITIYALSELTTTDYNFYD